MSTPESSPTPFSSSYEPQYASFQIPQKEVILPLPDFSNEDNAKNYDKGCYELAKKLGPIWNTSFYTLAKNYSKKKGKDNFFTGHQFTLSSFSINDIEKYLKMLRSNNLSLCKFREIGEFLLENIDHKISLISVIEIKNFKGFDFFGFFFDKTNRENIDKYLTKLD